VERRGEFWKDDKIRAQLRLALDCRSQAGQPVLPARRLRGKLNYSSDNFLSYLESMLTKRAMSSRIDDFSATVTREVVRRQVRRA
jgi:hypothetical protein